MDKQDNQDAIRDVTRAGWLLVVTGALSIALMSQHPSGGDGGVMTPLVHGGLQVVIIAQVAAFIIVLRSLGWTLLVIAGLLFFAMGQLAGLGAATINGFVVPALSSYPTGDIGRDIGLFGWEVNQALAKLGVISAGIGFALWSVLFWRNGERLLAAAGWVAGLVPAFLLAIGHMTMNLHGAIAAYFMQAAWVVALGWSFARRG